MSKASKRSGSRQRFAGIPHAVMETDKYRSLNGWAIKMLLELSKQYCGPGTNNGDLSLPYTKARELGWRSSGTLLRAERDLRANGFIIRTRVGGLHKCNLYALAWQPIDECIDRNTGLSKLDPHWKPTRQAPGTWKDEAEPWAD